MKDRTMLKWASAFVYPLFQDGDGDDPIHEKLDQLILIFCEPIAGIDASIGRSQFFVRYADERGVHLRCRARFESQPAYLSYLTQQALSRGLTVTVTSDAIQLGNACEMRDGFMEVEFQRYGGVEFAIMNYHLFHHCSNFVYEILVRTFHLSFEEKLVTKCRMLLGVLADYVTNGFGGIELARILRQNLHTLSKSSIADKKEELLWLDSVLSNQAMPFYSAEYLAGSGTYSHFLNKLSDTVRAVRESSDHMSVLSSHLHMLANRLGIPVELELVLYHWFSRKIETHLSL